MNIGEKTKKLLGRFLGMLRKRHPDIYALVIEKAKEKGVKPADYLGGLILKRIADEEEEDIDKLVEALSSNPMTGMGTQQPIDPLEMYKNYIETMKYMAKGTGELMGEIVGGVLRSTLDVVNQLRQEQPQQTSPPPRSEVDEFLTLLGGLSTISTAGKRKRVSKEVEEEVEKEMGEE